jgi:lipid II:glycine glycyltransferase (peptidoglycan interpeptide bridge formation enzyme)
LVGSEAELDCLALRSTEYPDAQRVEIRPMTSRLRSSSGFAELQRFRLHRLDLAPSADELFRRFHKNIQRNIRWAQEKLLRYEKGTSGALLEDFRRLLSLTRRRHFLPPQPLLWFRSLLDCMGERAAIRLAYKDETPVAGILTLCHNDVMVYKYGGSDSRYRQFGGMAFLLWRSIQEACQEGLREFDLGRSDCENAGLVTFKDRWGSRGSTLTYWTYGSLRSQGAAVKRASRCMRQIVPYLPERVLAAVGGLLYRHIG